MFSLLLVLAPPCPTLRPNGQRDDAATVTSPRWSDRNANNDVSHSEKSSSLRLLSNRLLLLLAGACSIISPASSSTPAAEALSAAQLLCAAVANAGLGDRPIVVLLPLGRFRGPDLPGS